MMNSPQRASRSRRRRLMRSVFWLLFPALGLLLAGCLLLVLLGVAQRTGWLETTETAASADGPADGDKELYICPMMCTPPLSKPGRCPACGMNLVKTNAGFGEPVGYVTIAPAARRVADIRTQRVVAQTVMRTIRAPGRVAYNESARGTITAYVDGRVERLIANYTGYEVETGGRVAILYSPELYNVQAEFIEARDALADTRPATERLQDIHQRFYDGARAKLLELGMTEEELRELEAGGDPQSRFPLTADLAGTVTELLVVEGQSVTAGEPLMRVADLSTVWLELEMYPEDAASIQYGQQVEAEVQSLPGTSISGRVAFVHPSVDPQKRTVRVRVVVPNEDGRLKIGDYATAVVKIPLESSPSPQYDPELAGKWISPKHPHVIENEPGACRICGESLVPASELGFADEPVDPDEMVVVPRSAVLMAGAHSVVYVEKAEGEFWLRPVVVGPVVDGEIVILQGLEEGEQVAVSGNFLIDSQMQLSGNPSLIDPSRYQPPKIREDPIEPTASSADLVEGEAGRELEALFEAYFEIQRTLAADEEVSEETAATLAQRANELRERPLPESMHEHLEVIGSQSEALASGDLDETRDRFKPVSRAVIELAAQARGEGAESTLVHVYCSMVDDGQGDWLQPVGPVANPFKGSSMLRCGTRVHEYPPLAGAGSDDSDDGEPRSAATDDDGVPR